MKRLFTALLAIVAVAGLARAANAQYMYLDSNGNGIHDTGDRLNPNGTPTTVDLYVRTDQNRDGTTAVCDTGDGPLSISVYMIDLMAVGGVVTYSGFINRQPTMTTTTGELNPDGVRYKNSWGGPTQLPPGQYRLCTLTITGMTGFPRIDIVDLVSGSTDITGFGTSCSALGFDNDYRLDGPNTQALLGSPGDFKDWDGLGPAGGDAPPVLAAIGNKTVDELSTLAFTATATDPNPAAIFTFTLDPGAPAGAILNPSTGAFLWIPAESQGPGTFTITLRVTNNASPPLSDSKTFTVTVREVNIAPVLNPIGNKIACGPGAPLTFTATAADLDIPSNNLTFSLDPGAPPGATIVSSTGAFSWTPLAFGTFPVTVRVTDNGTPPLSDFEAIAITVTAGPNVPPVLGAIGNRTVDELAPLAFTAVATDVGGPCQGDILTFSLDAGAPAGATIASSGAFAWTPTEAQGPGNYPITVRVTDSGVPQLSDLETITVTVNEVNAAPVLAPIGGNTVHVGSLLAFTATATDPDIPPNTLCFTLDAGQPPGATMNCGTGAFMWTPSPGQEGLYTITVRVTDNGVPPLSDSETITVGVLPEASAPTADAGGPYSGIVNSPVTFNGTHSFDPNGDALTYLWNFGDGHAGTGATPVHTYSASGTYNVTLRVTDPGGHFDDDMTTATIGSQVSVTLVLKNGRSTLNLDGEEHLKVAIEESELPYSSVIISTLRLSTNYPNAGTVSECLANDKRARIGDLDRNGAPDLEVWFSLACVKNLFRNTPNNTQVNLIVTGTFLSPTGEIPFRGIKVVTIKTGGGGGSVAALAYPNPMNPQAVLSFVTSTPGIASIQLFDLRGRMVRTLLPPQHLSAGAHEITIDGLNDQGAHLSSGVYFYRVLTADGPTMGSISVVK